MAGIRFSEEQQILLSRNTNVKKVSEKSISYSEEFKIQAVKEYHNGKSGTQIFKDAGFDLNMVGKDTTKQSLQRWRRTYSNFGELGLVGEKRGTHSTGRPKRAERTLGEQLAELQDRNAYLQMENEFLKKLEALERRLEKNR
ncbi:hypothetical protein [Turicibacter sanguinis]|uniref:hypothetical protein n=1 Tax=Turicibacter sanguinis TaxID=154288 RepID=UPI0021D4B6F9|nr:hypothetical protein [Turicibacter sanguinis]MCU7198009.1 hypothetical protein [Turicibacter sanguinis]